MSISIVSKDPKQVLDAFGIAPSLIKKMGHAGISVELKPGSIIFHSLIKDEHLKVPVVSGAVSMALGGKLGAASKASVAYNMTKAIHTLLKPIDLNEQSAIEVAAQAVTDFGKTIEKMKPQKVAATAAEVAKQIVKKPIFEEDDIAQDFDAANQEYHEQAAQMHPSETDEVPIPSHPAGPLAALKMTPVNLDLADCMYQPVKATTGSSIYHVIAMATGLQIAVRHKGSTLSLRVAGDLKKYKDRLSAAGFGLGNLNKGYLSIHMEVEDDVLAAKTVGALIVGTQIPMLTQVPDLSLIKGKGV